MEAIEERRAENAARRAAMTPEQIEAERMQAAKKRAERDAIVAAYKSRHPNTTLHRREILEAVILENFLKLAAHPDTKGEKG